MQAGRLSFWAGTALGAGMLISCGCVERGNQPWPIVPDVQPRTNFAKPVNRAQCVLIAAGVDKNQNFSVALSRNPNSCIAMVSGYQSTDCSGAQQVPERAKAPDHFFMGPIDGNVECEEALRVQQASPCKLYEFYSGGTFYRFCYDYGVSPPKLVSASCCLNHTAPCQ